MLFHDLTDRYVDTLFTQALAAQTDHLGSYLFADDPLNTADASKIDTNAELAAQLEDQSNNIDLSQEHFENLFYLRLFGSTTDINSLFTSTLSNDFDQMQFTVFADYLDANTGKNGFGADGKGRKALEQGNHCIGQSP